MLYLNAHTIKTTEAVFLNVLWFMSQWHSQIKMM